MRPGLRAALAAVVAAVISAARAGMAHGEAPPGPGSRLPAEQMVDVPVPIYVEPAGGGAIVGARLFYKPFGAGRYRPIEMKPLGGGFAVEVPCTETTTTGDLKYFVVFLDARGEVVGGVGSRQEPRVVVIKNEIGGEPPSLPGAAPPKPCPETTACVFPCNEGFPCQPGFVCVGWTCEPRPDDPPPKLPPRHGCGCRAAGEEPTGVAALCALAALAIARRRGARASEPAAGGRR